MFGAVNMTLTIASMHASCSAYVLDRGSGGNADTIEEIFYCYLNGCGVSGNASARPAHTVIPFRVKPDPHRDSSTGSGPAPPPAPAQAARKSTSTSARRPSATLRITPTCPQSPFA